MHSHHYCKTESAREAAIQESRSQRFNLPVRHPSKWNALLDILLASPMRLHRYRDLSRRLVEDTMYKKDCGDRK